MKKLFLILIAGIFLYADISNILLKIDKIETFNRSFMNMILPVCVNACNKGSNLCSTTAANSKKTILILKAVFNKKALINNSWLKEGDVFNGYKVVKVFSKEVLLEKDNKRVVLKFNQSLLKVSK